MVLLSTPIIFANVFTLKLFLILNSLSCLFPSSARNLIYVSDFPNTTTVGAKGCIVTPHLGASTEESEDNCAIMAVREIRDYLENGNIVHSVNFPDCNMGACTTAGRIGIRHRNEKGIIAKYTTILGEADINVSDMTNKGKGDYAYSLIDVDSAVTDDVVAKLQAVEGVLRVRVVK